MRGRQLLHHPAPPGLAERQVLELVERVPKLKQEPARRLDPQRAHERLELEVEEGAEAKGQHLLALALGHGHDLVVQQLQRAWGVGVVGRGSGFSGKGFVPRVGVLSGGEGPSLGAAGAER
jgi:hypothetical protein